MIKCIAAIDTKRGIADERGIPWQGLLPTDVRYYRDIIRPGTVIMGYGLYKELTVPPAQTNYVATSEPQESLRPGFQAVADAHAFLKQYHGDIWNLGGAILFESTFDLADELYLTLLDKDFNCTKFLPEYEKDFTLVSENEPITENGITQRFTIWKRK